MQSIASLVCISYTLKTKYIKKRAVPQMMTVRC